MELTESEKKLIEVVRSVKYDVRRSRRPSTMVVVFQPNGLLQVFKTIVPAKNGILKD